MLIQNQKPHESVYGPDDWKSAHEYAAEYIAQQCKERRCAPDQISDDEVKLALVEQSLRSPVFWIRNYASTVTKKAELVLIDPWIGQLLFDVVCESQRRLGVAQRVIEIKPRQVGYTTWLIGRAMWRAIQPNINVCFLVPDDDVAKDIAKRIGTVHNNLGWMKPMTRIENQVRVVFSNPDSRTREFDRGLDSQILITVPGPLRGFSPHVVVLSEYAHIWDISKIEPSEMLDALLSGMSAGEESAVFIDTTPNGFDDDYYPMACEAVERNPKWARSWERKTIPSREEIITGAIGLPDRPADGWVPVFTSFLWHEQYACKGPQTPFGQLPALTSQQRQHLSATIGKEEKYGNDEETMLRDRYGATPERLWWRRWKLDNDVKGHDARHKLLKFHQEYAVSWSDAFVDFGSAAFDAVGLDAVSRQWRPPSARGMLRNVNTNGYERWVVDETDLAYQWHEMRFWAPSETGEMYVIGVDLAESFENMDANQTYACVLRRRDYKQVAVYESRAPMHRVRAALFSMYRYFNNAFLGIEVKGFGKNLVREMYDMGARNQYKWKRLDQEFPEDTKFLGWETSENTRHGMESIVMELIATRGEGGAPRPGIILRDKKTIDQLKQLKRDERTEKLKARGGGLDDASDALMIACALCRDPNNTYAPPRAVQERAVDGALYSYQQIMQSGRAYDRNNPSLSDL